VVRLLHDPALVSRLAREGVGVLDDPEISDDEGRWIESADSRAFSADPYRQGRVLTALVDELPVSVCLATARLPAGLVGFFETAHFHDTIRSGGAVRLGLAAYLAKAGPDVAAVVSIETALMEARRDVTLPVGGLCVAPGIRWRSVPRGTLEAYETLWAGLAAQGLPLVESAFHLSSCLPKIPPLSPEALESVLIEPNGAGSFAVGELPEGLLAILKVVQATRSREAALCAAQEQGAEQAEAHEILEGLLSEGLLRDHGSEGAAQLERSTSTRTPSR